MSYYNTVTIICDECEVEEQNRTDSKDLPYGWVEIDSNYPNSITLQEGAYNLCPDCLVYVSINDFDTKWVIKTGKGE